MSNGLSPPRSAASSASRAGARGRCARRPASRSTPRRRSRRPRDLRARRHRLGRRGAPRDRGARGALARRAHRHGGEPALRRPGDDGDEDLRPAHGVAELDLPAPERGRREGRADALRQAATGRSSTGTASHVRHATAHATDDTAIRMRPSTTARRSRTTSTSPSDKRLQRALEQWQPELPRVVERHGAARASRTTTSTCAPRSASTRRAGRTSTT